MTRLCAHHQQVYATRAAALRNRTHHPGQGRKALAREAATVARQCRACIESA